ncbi:MAG TPA: sigma-70 family RNA polymerase sigma factor [Acidimicrobiales bacterium]|nr:sigma-70 family RNA polymerase sigma factor [Acidimicrobiales bacterium]
MAKGSAAQGNSTRGAAGGADHDLVRVYLEGIGRYPLLTKEDEALLARRIEDGRRAKDELERRAGALSPETLRDLNRLVRDGHAATDEFVNANLRLVVSIAKKYQSPEMPLLDLIQEGNIGLMHAVEKFDWRKGFKFSTYATWWIRQAIGRGIDNTGRMVRLPVHAGDQIRRVLRVRADLEGRLGRQPSSAELAEETQMSEADVAVLLQYVIDPVSLATPVGADGDAELADVVIDAGAPSPFDQVAQSMLTAEVDKLLAGLDEREREILRLRYGLDRGEPRTLEEVGDAMHLTRERIRQIERSALGKLRHPSKERGTKDLIAS